MTHLLQYLSVEAIDVAILWLIDEEEVALGFHLSHHLLHTRQQDPIVFHIFLRQSDRLTDILQGFPLCLSTTRTSRESWNKDEVIFVLFFHNNGIAHGSGPPLVVTLFTFVHACHLYLFQL